MALSLRPQQLRSLHHNSHHSLHLQVKDSPPPYRENTRQRALFPKGQFVENFRMRAMIKKNDDGQAGWRTPKWLHGSTKRGGLRWSPYQIMVSVVASCATCQTGAPSFWSFLFPHQFIYSSDPADVDLEQLSDLWAKTLDVKRKPHEIAKALKHSYSFVVVLDRGEGTETFQRRLVGFGRAVSDGAFIATICDVAVDPAYQRRGIGRRILKELVKNMKQRRGPTGFAVFPPPKARLFFWSIGFRSDRSFRFMTYRGRLLESAPQDEDQLDPQ